MKTTYFYNDGYTAMLFSTKLLLDDISIDVIATLTSSPTQLSDESDSEIFDCVMSDLGLAELIERSETVQFQTRQDFIEQILERAAIAQGV